MNASTKGNARDSGYEEHPDHWYVEPAWSVQALLEREAFIGGVHDPACGGGNIPKVCLAHNIRATGSDIVDRGYGPAQDFLTDRTARENIITNPPFKLATEFALHGLRLVDAFRGKVCILQQLSWLEGKARGEVLFDRGQLVQVWVFRRRVSMPPGGTNIEAKGGSKAFAWFVFQASHAGPCHLGWLA